jgi:hypothetical protein
MTIIPDRSGRGTNTLSIHKMPSEGRGEYEVTGRQGETVAGSLTGRQFVLSTAFGSKRTEVVLGVQGGKRRLRLLPKSGMPQIPRQIAALLLLPQSTREESRVSSALPVLLSGRYIMDLEFHLDALTNDLAEITPVAVIARSGDVHNADSMQVVDVEDRYARILAVAALADSLPSPLSHLISDYFDLVTRFDRVGKDVERKVSHVIAALQDIEVEYLPGSDPLPALESLLGIVKTPMTIPTPQETPSDSPEIALRSEHIYRLRKTRGKGAAKFKAEVQDAYDRTCAFCGLKAPGIKGRMFPGVDAAHILPWGNYDLDVVQNGLMLCKQHHWAFDNHLLTLRHSNGEYFVDAAPDVHQLFADDALTLEILMSAVGEIPEDRLPRANMRPEPRYILELYSVYN